MITIRQKEERGHADHGWLNTYHTFSFAGYYDPRNMGFRSLRVINEDRVTSGQGFGTHAHRDMEIITYVLEGALEHKDSMGTSSVIRPGEIQRMSAGTGVTHSEYNHSKTEPVHFLQIWIMPERAGLPPGYAQQMFPVEERRDRLRLIASRAGRDGSISINQDADLFSAVLTGGETVMHRFGEGRHGWLQVARGEVTANGTTLTAGDGAAISGEPELRITADEEAEVLLFDLA